MQNRWEPTLAQKKEFIPMNKEMIEKANEILFLINENEKAVEELQKYVETGRTLYTKSSYSNWSDNIPQPIPLEDWEIRLMIHNKKQRINALKAELERL